MSIIFCIGNGESRKDYDLTTLKQHGNIYGANAVHRDYSDILDYLVCCDQRMVDEALNLNAYKGIIYTRKKWISRYANPRVQGLPDFPWKEKDKWTQHFHWGSGLHAVHLACVKLAKVVIMIGHDFYSADKLHNNIYKNTPNYLPDHVNGVDYSFWILQFERLFKTYPDTQFYFCQPNVKDWQVPEQWKSTNFFMQELGELQNELATGA